MRQYETIFILDPDLSDEGRVPVFDRINAVIPEQGGTLLKVDEWGARRLAYAIKKKSRGYYVRVEYCGNGDVVNEMERFFRIDDRVLKYMTVLLDKDADLEKLLEELQAAEAEKATSTENPPEENEPSPGADTEPTAVESEDAKDEPQTEPAKEA